MLLVTVQWSFLEQSLCICRRSKRAVNARICNHFICVFSAHESVALGAYVFTFHVNFTMTRLASTTFFSHNSMQMGLVQVANR